MFGVCVLSGRAPSLFSVLVFASELILHLPPYPPVLGWGSRQPLPCSVRMELLNPQPRAHYRHPEQCKMCYLSLQQCCLLYQRDSLCLGSDGNKRQTPGGSAPAPGGADVRWQGTLLGTEQHWGQAQSSTRVHGAVQQ